MTSYTVQWNGVPEGGQVLLRVGVGGMAVDLVQPTFAEMPVHLVAEYLSYQVRASEAGAYVDVDHSGPMLLIGGADVVEAGSSDPGLTGIEYPVDSSPTLGHSTEGARPSADASATSGSSTSLSAADQQVLSHLSNLIGSLTRNSQGDASILKGILSAHRTVSQGVTAFLTGTPLPVEPNPGSGGPIVADTDTTTGLLSSLGQNAVAMTQALNSMSDARAAQYAAAADKENEAKKGTPGTTPSTGGGQPTSGQPGSGPPATTGGGNGGNGQPSGGGGSAQSTPPGQLLARPAGSKQTPRTWYEATTIIEYTINGMVYSLGGFSDGTWALGRTPQPMEIIHPNGTTEIAPQTIVFDIPIEKTKWDAFIEQLQAQMPPSNPSPDESSSTVLKIFSTILDMTPLIGNVKLGIEAIIGHDIITWDELDPSTRALYAVCVLMVTPIGAKLMQGLGSGVRAALGTTERAIARGEALTAQQIANIRKVEDAIAEARTIKCAGGEVKLASSGATTEVAESGRLIPESVCFAPGTLVHMANGETRAIEHIAAGDAVRCARNAAFDPQHDSVASGRVTRVFHYRIDGEILEFTFESAAGERASFDVTAGHRFGTSGGYVAARHLELGSLVLGRLGHPHRLVSKSSRPYCAEVFNLEVEHHHNYFVAPTGILVHNGCEEITQGQMEQAVDNGQVPGMTRENPAISEPGFSDHLPINRGREYINNLIASAKKDVRAARDAYRIGEATRQEVETLDEVYKKLFDIRRNSTFPDLPVTEGGKSIALEFKTPKAGQSLYKYFNARHGPDEGPEAFINQMNMRIGSLPTEMESQLVVDLRFSETAKLSSLTNPADMETFLTNEAEELRSVLTTGAYEGRNVGTVYKQIRFITGGLNNPVLSDPFPFVP